MKTIVRGEHIDYETYRFLRECGITAIVLLKFDITIGPYIAFKDVYEQNINSIKVLDDPEYLTQFYVGISGTEMDVLEKNEERIVIARQTYTIDATRATNVLLLCIDNKISAPAASKLANDLLTNSNAEPDLLEELIMQLKDVASDLKSKLRDIPKRTFLEPQRLERMPNPRKLTKFKRFTTTVFKIFQNRELNEIELCFPNLQKSMFFIRISFESHDMARFFEILFSQMIIEKETAFSIDINKHHAGLYLGLTLVLPPNKRNFVERLAGALNMAGFSISLVRENELENQWVAPLGVIIGNSLKISRKHKDYIQVLDSPIQFISLFRSKHLSPFTITKLIQALDDMYAVILCRGIDKNKAAVEIILTKLHSTKAELDQFNLPTELAEHFKKVRGRRTIADTVKDLLLRHCSKGTKLSLQEVKGFFGKE
ncbi:MAG: hypothetical protein ACFFCD_12295 [Promethearchaeota archaeon]